MTTTIQSTQSTLPGKAQIQSALIQAIGEIAGTPHVAVKVKDVRTRAFEIMGIDPNSFDAANWGGVSRNPAVKALTSNYYLLKKKGQCADAGRGKYSLTPTGYALFSGMSGTTPSPRTDTAPQVESKSEVRKATSVAASSNKRITVMAGGTTLDLPEAPKTDGYLLSLQLANSPCFGVAFSGSSKVCGRCPIAGACAEARASRLGDLARIVKQGVSDGNLGVMLGLVEPPAPEPETIEAPAPAPTGVDMSDLTVLPVEMEGIPCDCCKQEFAVGTNGVIIPNFGLVHEGCVEVALARKGA